MCLRREMHSFFKGMLHHDNRFILLIYFLKHGPAQLQRLDRKLKIRMWQVWILYFPKAKNKGADQTSRMRRLVCAFDVRKPPKTALLASRSNY